MTRPIAVAALLGALGAQTSAADDNLNPPINMPSSYRTECGSCHVPYPPHLLPAGGIFSSPGWRDIMDDLSNHFGENAELEEAMHRLIEQYLVDNAADGGRRFRSRTEPPRLTTTLWFRRNHGTVKSYYASPQVTTPANCPACHPRAEHWRYIKEDVVLPRHARHPERANAQARK